MPTIDLLLSGGGYRATLFHLGVLRFLYEHRFPDQSDAQSGLDAVKLISGVSGGSITACHFVAFRDVYLKSFPSAAEALLTFTRNVDLRREVLKSHRETHEVVREKLFPKGYPTSTVPPDIKLVVLATSLRTANCIAFENSTIRVYEFNHSDGKLECRNTIEKGSMCVSKLIHASSAFPPFLPPFKLGKSQIAQGITEEMLARQIRIDEPLADGGIRDNLGIEWYRSNHDIASGENITAISNAGRPFDWDQTEIATQTWGSWQKRINRTIDILMSRIGQLELATPGNSSAVKIDIGGWTTLPEASPDDLSLTSRVGELTAAVPTDLVRLTPTQSYCITRLGYDVAKKSFGDRLNRRKQPDDSFWKDLFPKGNPTVEWKQSDPHASSLQKILEHELGLAPRSWGGWIKRVLRVPFDLWDYYWQLPWHWLLRYVLPIVLSSIIFFSVYGACCTYNKITSHSQTSVQLPVVEIGSIENMIQPLAVELARSKNGKFLELWEGRCVRLNFQLDKGSSENYLDYDKMVGSDEIGVPTDYPIQLEFRFYGTWLPKDDVPLTKGSMVQVSGRVKEVRAITPRRIEVVVDQATFAPSPTTSQPK